MTLRALLTSLCITLQMILSIACVKDPEPSHEDVALEEMMPPPIASDSGGDAQQVDEGGELTAAHQPGEMEDLSSCHIDCFGTISCVEGQVYRMASSPLPCGEGLTCPETLEYTCAQGCAFTQVYPGALDIDTHGYVILCNEFDESRVGHACRSDLDCPSPLPEELPDGSVNTPAYLECVDGACAERPAVEVADYLAPCELTIDATYIKSHVAIESSACSEGVCLIGPPEQGSSCIPQGCSLLCSQDADCPGGSLCVAGEWYAHDPDLNPPPRYCKPGARETFGSGLRCP